MSATKHNSSGTGGSPHQVPPEPNRWPSIGLAVGVHALLLAFLVVGINWQNHQPVAVEAEVWDMKVQSAAPPAPTPPPQPEPEPEPEPETPPPPRPAPRVVEPPKVEQPAPPKQPDIALEREKKRKQELKRKEEEQVEREREQERELAKQQKREDEKKAKAQAQAEKKAREEAEKKELAKQEEAEKKKAEKEKTEKLAKEKAAKEKADKLAKEKAEKAENAKFAKLRDDEMKRMMAGAGNPGSTGSAEKSTAPRIDKGYIASIASKIKSNTTYPGSTDVPGNPEVEFKVEQLPTGEIISVRKTKSSGIPAFDDAVERGINKSSPLPKKKDGTVERSLPVSFKLKDLN
jgi:colicin import membrane protein